jgi:hypothetical protein
MLRLGNLIHANHRYIRTILATEVSFAPVLPHAPSPHIIRGRSTRNGRHNNLLDLQVRPDRHTFQEAKASLSLLANVDHCARLASLADLRLRPTTLACFQLSRRKASSNHTNIQLRDSHELVVAAIDIDSW